jgi:hypothetical protein
MNFLQVLRPTTLEPLAEVTDDPDGSPSASPDFALDAGAVRVYFEVFTFRGGPLDRWGRAINRLASALYGASRASKVVRNVFVTAPLDFGGLDGPDQSKVARLIAKQQQGEWCKPISGGEVRIRWESVEVEPSQVTTLSPWEARFQIMPSGCPSPLPAGSPDPDAYVRWGISEIEGLRQISARGIHGLCLVANLSGAHPRQVMTDALIKKLKRKREQYREEAPYVAVMNFPPGWQAVLTNVFAVFRDVVSDVIMREKSHWISAIHGISPRTGYSHDNQPPIAIVLTNPLADHPTPVGLFPGMTVLPLVY